MVTSNRGNISVSTDYGRSWSATERPWQHAFDFAKDWTQTVWSSLYPYRRKGVMAMTAQRRPEGGHAVKIRFGRVRMKKSGDLPTGKQVRTQPTR